MGEGRRKRGRIRYLLMDDVKSGKGCDKREEQRKLFHENLPSGKNKNEDVLGVWGYFILIFSLLSFTVFNISL